MYQHSRPSSRPSSNPGPSSQANTSRTNNPRDPLAERPRSSFDMDMAEHGVGGGDDRGDDEETQARVVKTVNKINQVMQQFFLKGALTIVSSRVMLPQTFNEKGEPKQNKWFNVLIGDADVLLKDMMEWRLADVVNYRPPVLVIEIYIDTAELTRNQTLVILDEDGKRWDVDEALNPPEDATSRPQGVTRRATKVTLERWTVEIGPKSALSKEELSDPLPNVYKKAVVLIRSVFTHTRLLPAMRYHRRIQKQPADRPSLKPKFRIVNGDTESPRADTLDTRLCPDYEPVTEKYRFHPSNSPVGPLCISVQYRTNCDFRVDNAESLLSSRFMGLDDYDFKPSLPSGRDGRAVPGSLPVNRNYQQARPSPGEAYGSMSTFHQVGPQAGSSPISALRAARDLPVSPGESPPQKLPPNHRRAQGSKSSLRSDSAPSYPRRPSVSFQPFKAGSLSSSPAPGPQVPPSPGSSVGRTTTPSMHTRNRSSQYALPQTALRTPSIPSETAVASSASSSPKPAPISRYTSSFSNRKSRFSSGGTNKSEEDNVGSEKGSISSAQPGSGIINDNDGGSSGSFQTDEENISDLLKLLESKKELKSFSKTDAAARDASTKRTASMLSKYQRMRDSNAALSDSLSSSLLLHRSSSSSSRQLSSVPPMVAGTSVSTSSSPGKPISPHTPHTPAIPSRLSANSIVEYNEPRRSHGRNRSRSDAPSSTGEASSETASTARGDPASRSSGTTTTTTTAIDIPNSPQPWPYVRRSSSVSQQPRLPVTTADDDPDIFGHRSASLPVDDRPDLSLSELLTLHHHQRHASSTGTTGATAPPLPPTSERHEPGAEPVPDDTDVTKPPTSPSLPSSSAASSRPTSRHERLARRGSLDGPTSDPRPSSALAGGPTSSSAPYRSARAGSSSSTAPVSRSSGSRRAFGSSSSGRYSFTSRTAPTTTTQPDDDEPLLFTMSDFGASRRSLEEARGGGSAGERGKERGRRGGSPWRGM